MTLKAHKQYADTHTLEEFVKTYGEEWEFLYDVLRNAKEGNIKIKKLSENEGYLKKDDYEYGHTDAFAERIPLYIDSPNKWYYTTQIQSIDWEKKIFTTKNSIYSFDFNEKTC